MKEIKFNEYILHRPTVVIRACYPEYNLFIRYYYQQKHHDLEGYWNPRIFFTVCGISEQFTTEKMPYKAFLDMQNDIDKLRKFINDFFLRHDLPFVLT